MQRVYALSVAWFVPVPVVPQVVVPAPGQGGGGQSDTVVPGVVRGQACAGAANSADTHGSQMGISGSRTSSTVSVRSHESRGSFSGYVLAYRSRRAPKSIALSSFSDDGLVSGE